MTFMIFKAPGPHRIHGYDVEYKVIDEADVPEALANGWSDTAIGAGQARERAIAAEKEAQIAETENSAASALADETKPPTRDELEQMATKLGLPFRPNTSDKKLRALIDAAVKSTE